MAFYPGELRPQAAVGDLMELVAMLSCMCSYVCHVADPRLTYNCKDLLLDDLALASMPNCRSLDRYVVLYVLLRLSCC